jgi:hypothetical protein
VCGRRQLVERMRSAHTVVTVWQDTTECEKMPAESVRPEMSGKSEGREDGLAVHGIERFPMNLMEGTRSAWAAAWRRALVASIVAVQLFLFCLILKRTDSRVSGRGRTKEERWRLVVGSPGKFDGWLWVGSHKSRAVVRAIGSQGLGIIVLQE